ncbi:thiol-disulfide oxidoreductase ResA [Shimazuella kribbensis]|uniref:thiol-disulfide oxidoreductase ResA n=1 Tax=Shimazuella kribbensis TaxID=139808 RepID=UPI0003FFDCBB|nr:thiol-disulfide oxidoreductase ResA [Shimazuella kribbensis]
MKKQTRYWVRRILLLCLVGLVGYAIYQVSTDTGGKPVEGDEAPNFTLTTLDGKQMSLSDLKGKAVMLNFWGTWCPPCKTEMPAIQQAYMMNKNRGFVVVSINIRENELPVSNFAKQMGLTFPIWMDKEREVVKQYKIGPIPSSFFINREGVIEKRIEGPLQLSQLQYFINQIIS